MSASPLAYWVHHWQPFLIKFTDTFGIRYYGLAYILGFVGATLLMKRASHRGRSPVPSAQVLDLMVFLVIGVMVGGRLGYFLFYHGESLRQNPLEFFRVWDGGMAFHGGLLGVLVGMYWFARSRKLSFLSLGDLVTSVTPLGLLFGRLANFINGELWGRPTTVPWAVIFPQSTPVAGNLVPRHPSQLYEALLEGLVLLVYLQWRFWRTDVTQKHAGRLAGEFLVGYGVARILCEIFREPDASLLLGLSRGTFYSVFLIAGGLVLILRRPASRAPARRAP